MKYPANAGRPLVGYEEFYVALNKASFHNAAEDRQEVTEAHNAELLAAKIANDNGWRYWQIEQAFQAANPLVVFDALMQYVMDDLRGREK